MHGEGKPIFTDGDEIKKTPEAAGAQSEKPKEPSGLTEEETDDFLEKFSRMIEDQDKNR